VHHDVLNEFETFFDGVPASVRAELSFFLVKLADEWHVEEHGAHGYERAARALFNAQTRTGRIGNLISAAAFVDVYFSLKSGQRAKARRWHSLQATNAVKIDGERLPEMADAAQLWAELRKTRLSPAAIVAALVPETGQRATPAARRAVGQRRRSISAPTVDANGPGKAF